MSSGKGEGNHVAPESKEMERQNVVCRVASLPLVSSTCHALTSTYASTKETHPYLKSACEVAEKGVRTLAAAAVCGTQVLVARLEPQIATANVYACKGLDKLEEKLPILQQPSEKVVADTRELVSTKVNGARDAVSSTVNGAKDAVASRVLGVARGAVQGSMETTHFVVNSVRGSRVGEMVATGMEAMLEKSEGVVDYFLPMSEQELAELAASAEGFETAMEDQQKAMEDQQKEQKSYFVRLGSLSAKLRHRLMPHVLAKLKDARQSTQDALSQLHQAVVLIERVKEGVDQKLQSVQEMLHRMWLAWIQKHPEDHKPNDSSVQPEVEPQTLTMFRGLIQQLRFSYTNLLSQLQGLPTSIQDRARRVWHMVADLHPSFLTAQTFEEVPPAVLALTSERLSKARGSVDEIVDYVVQNVPLPWVVGPFAPNLVEQPYALSSVNCLHARYHLIPESRNLSEGSAQRHEDPQSADTDKFPERVVAPKN